MKYILDVENLSSLKALILQDLRELGVKIPKLKKNKGKEHEITSSSAHSGVFGNYLTSVPCTFVYGCGPVPKFLVDAVTILEKHFQVEGLFRKSGSLARQKELKAKAEHGEDLNDANPLDLASLLKQFFRELPDPLLTLHLHDTFLKCYAMDNEDVRTTAILLLCHLMPWQHLSTLRFMMMFLQKVAEHSELNKMDIPNLSVCLTPNIMHSNSKTDKVNLSEGKHLQIQTNVVQMLITYSEDIGMVPESVCEKATMLVTCFNSEDELEKSDMVSISENNSKSTKKKKRRSGSLGGLVSNLSSSFSKWRSKDNKNHNASNMSTRSAMSYLSFDKSGMYGAGTDIPDATLPLSGECAGYMEATPKLMRKRKLEEEGVPFSASKKKAILQNMPQMATLAGTPFTPQSRRGLGSEFMDTPSIKFATNSEMQFHAIATPQSSRRKMDKIFSSSSATKVKRNSSGKASCFSPKSSKGSVRRTMKGFFRRLSGGKECDATPGGSMENLASECCGTPDSLSIMDPSAGQKKKSFFRRHKKTPSSPARLVTQLPEELRMTRVERGMAQQGSASTIQSEPAGSTVSPMNVYDGDLSFSNTELAARLRSDLFMQTPMGLTPEEVESYINTSVTHKLHVRGLSADGTPLGPKALRRGKPNTVRAGLPYEYQKRRSADTDTLQLIAAEMQMKQEESVSALDTSPILPKGNHATVRNGVAMEEDQEMSMHRAVSASSVCSAQDDHGLEADHDRAFINESILADITHVGETHTDSIHKMCEDHGLSVSGSEEKTTERSCKSQSVDQTYYSKLTLKLRHQQSVDSIDSAIEAGNSGDNDSPQCSKEAYFGSSYSIGSVDSGLSLNEHGLHHNQESGMNPPKTSFSAQPILHIPEQTQHMLSRIGAIEKSDALSTSELAEEEWGSLTSLKDFNADDLTPEDPRRQSILQLLEKKTVTSRRQQLEDVGPELVELAKRKASPMRFHNSNLRQQPGKSPVTIPKIFSKSDKDARSSLINNITGKSGHLTPGRKPDLPISTSLVRPTRGVQVARSQLDRSILPKKFSLPKEAEEKPTTPTMIDVVRDETIGHTPVCALDKPGIYSINIDMDATPTSSHAITGKTPLHDSNNCNVRVPKIKPNLVSAKNVTDRLISKVNVNHANSPSIRVPKILSSKYRSPVKPAKRLQSPKGFTPSPKKYTHSKSHPRGTSPIPKHITDWDI